MKKAFNYLEKNPDSYLERLYLQTKARLTHNSKKRHQLLLELMHKYYNSVSATERIKLHTTVAYSYNDIGKHDSAIYYIQQITPLIEANNISNSVLANFYTIKAFLYINKVANSNFNKIAKVALDSALIKADHQPGLLAPVYAQLSQLKYNQKDYRKAYLDLKLYTHFIEQQKIGYKNNQLAFLTINFKLHDKQMEIIKIRQSRLLIVILFIIIILISLILFYLYKQKVSHQKQTMLKLMTLTAKEKNEWKNKFKISESTINNYRLKNHTYFEWDSFRVSFVLKYPEFGKQLQSRYRNFKPVDLKYCMCISCGMSNKQTATLIGVTPDAVKKAKRKLRIMFNVKNSIQLSDYLNSFCNSQGNIK